MKYLQLLFDNEITDLCNFSICAQVHLTKNAYTNMATINHSILLVVKALIIGEICVTIVLFGYLSAINRLI